MTFKQVLSCAAVSTSLRHFKDVPGIDFYTFWAVDKAQKISGHQVRTPYKEQIKYRAVLTSHAERSSDTRLKQATAFWQTLVHQGINHPMLLTVTR